MPSVHQLVENSDEAFRIDNEALRHLRQDTTLGMDGKDDTAMVQYLII